MAARSILRRGYQNFVHQRAVATTITCRSFHGMPFMEEYKFRRETETERGWVSHMSSLALRNWESVKVVCDGMFPKQRNDVRIMLLQMRIVLELLATICSGTNLTRKERRLFIHITSDVFMRLPVAISVGVPVVEFLLPAFLVLYPKVLSKEKGDMVKRKLIARLEYSKFLEDTAIEMAKIVPNSQAGHFKPTYRDLTAFITASLYSRRVPVKDVWCFAKFFNDDVTVDNLRRAHLVNMCKFMGITPCGKDDNLRVMLLERLNWIKKNDKLIQAKGVESLSEADLHKVCRARGIYVGEEMRQQLCDWLDLSLNHFVPSSILVLSRAFTRAGKKPVEAVLKTLRVLPSEVLNSVGITSLPCEDVLIDQKRKFDYLRNQDELVKKQKMKLLKMKQAATIQARTRAGDKQEQLYEYIIAPLSSALSFSEECKMISRLVNKEIHLYNGFGDKEDGAGEKQNTRAYGAANDQDVELYDKAEASSVLSNKVHAMLQNLEKEMDDAGIKIDVLQAFDRYFDRKVGLELVAASLHLKDIFDKDGVQELVSNLSIYKENILKLNLADEDLNAGN